MKKKCRNFKIIALTSLLLVLCIVSLSWFTKKEPNTFGTSISTGKIKYTFNDTAQNIFYSSFDTEQDDFVDDGGDIEGGVYIPATSVKVQANNVDVADTYSIEQSTSVRFISVTTPTPCTDKISWSVSDAKKIKVSENGRVVAMGKIGDSAVVTLTLKDRSPTNPRPNIVKNITVTIIPPSTPSDVSNNFLPANTQIMRSPLSLVNYSDIDSKLRLSLSWKYKNAEYEEGTGNRTVYTGDALDAILSKITGQKIIIYNGESPIKAVFETASNGSSLWQTTGSTAKLVLQDKNGVKWDITSLALTDAEKIAIQADPNSYNYPLTIIDSAKRMFYYGGLTAAEDYGDIVPKTNLLQVEKPTEAQIAAATIPAINTITVMESYTLFSTKKIFGIDIAFQARQSDYFVLGAQNRNDKWFDVSTCEFHANTH